ncbi:ribonuclease HI [Laspinema olomoucense]|uniref:ribonuclease HI n=1 Tax=Laspinema olomoucense TaxID=3231600 RepID=UPI0021BA52EF|nr:RNase H family protein [Laspinema sp. D3d]MCT7971165.1 reverse transcriptase-like protein [Laspinema sp. D3d]
MKKIEVYCDGSCKDASTKNGFGGWGIVINSQGFPTKYVSGYVPKTRRPYVDSYVVELIAIIQALKQIQKALFQGYHITIHSDCLHLVETINKGLWKRQTKYQKYWFKFEKVYYPSPNISIKWIKGHNGNSFNEKADKLAKDARCGKIVKDFYLNP